MNEYFKEVSIFSSKKNELINVTNIVRNALKESLLTNGMVYLFVPHTTAAITINENADPDVKTDILLGLNRISPNLKEYLHYENNSDAHIKSSIIGINETIMFNDGKLMLGTWQGIYFCEFDGPRNRRFFIKIIE